MKRVVSFGHTRKDTWKVKIGFIEAIKKIPFISHILCDYQEWRQFGVHWQYYGDDPDFKVPSLIEFLYDNYKQRKQIKNCDHTNMEVDSHITGDSGSEDLHCPDCGFTDHIQYY